MARIVQTNLGQIIWYCNIFDILENIFICKKKSMIFSRANLYEYSFVIFILCQIYLDIHLSKKKAYLSHTATWCYHPEFKKMYHFYQPCPCACLYPPPALPCPCPIAVSQSGWYIDGPPSARNLLAPGSIDCQPTQNMELPISQNRGLTQTLEIYWKTTSKVTLQAWNNGPGVAGAVLQTRLSFIHSFIH